MKYEYLLCLLALLLVAYFIKWKYKVSAFKSTKQLLVFYFIVFVIGSIWDNFAVWRGHWIYPGRGITGIFVGLVPIEDYAFALVTSYTVLILNKVLQKEFR